MCSLFDQFMHKIDGRLMRIHLSFSLLYNLMYYDSSPYVGLWEKKMSAHYMAKQICIMIILLINSCALFLMIVQSFTLSVVITERKFNASHAVYHKPSV